MSRQLDRAIGDLSERLCLLGAIVENNLRQAVEAIETRDARLALAVVEYDRRVDREEVDLETECLTTLALHQPVAADLRLIVSVLKANNDLERIGDLAVNVARRAVHLAGHSFPGRTFDVPGMAERVQSMLRRSLDSLVKRDAAQARGVLASDDEVDRRYRQVYDQVKGVVRSDLGNVDALIHMLSVFRHLERVADHACNIAEDTLYLVEGEIVRHRRVTEAMGEPPDAVAASGPCVG